MPGKDFADRLTERLASLSEQVRQDHPDLTRLADAFVERLAAANAGASAPQVGDIFPDFVLPSITGELVASHDLLQGPSVVCFLRGHWCPYCTTEADAILEALPELEAAKVTVVLVTPDRPAFAAQLGGGQSSIRVLCDIDNAFSFTLGLLAIMDEETVAWLKADGDDLPRYQGNDLWSVPIPATFVLGRGSVVTDRFVDPDYRRRMPISDLLDAVKKAAAS